MKDLERIKNLTLKKSKISSPEKRSVEEGSSFSPTSVPRHRATTEVDETEMKRRIQTAIVDVEDSVKDEVVDMDVTIEKSASSSLLRDYWNNLHDPSTEFHHRRKRKNV